MKNGVSYSECSPWLAMKAAELIKSKGYILGRPLTDAYRVSGTHYVHFETGMDDNYSYGVAILKPRFGKKKKLLSKEEKTVELKALHIGTLKVSDMKNSTWLLNVYGRAHSTELKELATELWETLKYPIHMVLELESPKLEDDGDI